MLNNVGCTADYVENVPHKKVNISSRVTDKWLFFTYQMGYRDRTFGWLNSSRRLAKDFAITVSSAENIVMIAFSMLLLNRI